MDRRVPNTDEFADHYGRLVAKRLKEDLAREINEPDYMPQEDFETCLARMEALSANAVEYANKFGGLAIANHRSLETESGGHGEDKSAEIASLSADLEQEDLEAAERWFW